MALSPQELEQLTAWVESALNGSIRPDEVEVLQDRLAQNSEMREYYYQLMVVYLGLEDLEENAPVPKDWTVPTGSRGLRILNRRLIPILSSVAALLLIALCLSWILKVKPSVGMLETSQSCQWGSVGKPGWGGKVMPGMLALEEGRAGLTLGEGVHLILEGPVTLEVFNKDRIRVDAGQVYAQVDQKAIGFEVGIPGGRVIDLSTEFAVDVQAQHSEVHVFKGAVALEISSGHHLQSRTLSEEQAVRVDYLEGDMKMISFKPHGFTRRLRDNGRLAWRGEWINLVDVVSGGNGLGGGQPKLGIGLSTAKPDSQPVSMERIPSTGFHTLHSHPFIDGVFVPDSNNLCEISSEGMIWVGRPQTSGWGDIGWIGPFAETSSPSSLYVGANTGISFDLWAIRDTFGSVHVYEFSTSVTRPEGEDTAVDVWVLVNGRVRAYHQGLSSGADLRMLKCPLLWTDRFLTLVVTESNDASTTYDAVLFHDPQLKLQSVTPQEVCTIGKEASTRVQP